MLLMVSGIASVRQFKQVPTTYFNGEIKKKYIYIYIYIYSSYLELCCKHTNHTKKGHRVQTATAHMHILI